MISAAEKATRKRVRYASDPEFAARIRERNRIRYATDPVYRAKVIKQATETAKRARERRPATRTCPALCECCGRRKAVVWDHDHDTGLFRGWLCKPCNSSIGILGDTMSAIQNALQYLERAING